jgi:TM2 domain-containing membrane protein YozV
MATNYVTCPGCLTQNPGMNIRCINCGTALPPAPMQHMPNYGQPVRVPGADKKIPAGICGILLGGLGIHKFILGYQTEGVIMLAVWLIGAVFLCGIPSLVISVIGIIEGIIYLTKSDEEFAYTYLLNRKPWF